MKKYFAFILLIFSLVSCNQSKSDLHLIKDSAYREMVHAQFLEQKELAAGRADVLFDVFNLDLTTAEKEGLEFLYAFMPLSDLALNDGAYYLRQVQTALEARSFFHWGKTIPEDIFLHFVLPYRVNNEYTDTARQVFFAELKDRIAQMPMDEAALEVNHWCHEKVVYQSTDERTSGPLTTVRTAFGRCGEESTFTASAMRAVGIPARQVYTPRWAHTDDNHAWVEVWIDGSWHFLGACEPEPLLDMAWFDEPVKRAMMTHTFVFGKYNGTEETVQRSDRYARLNMLKNYTDVKSMAVKVVNEFDEAVADVRVDFGLYNYAEFYPMVTQYTDENGSCSIRTGFGDLLLHVSKDGISSSVVAPADFQDTLKVVLGSNSQFFPAGEYTFTPPAKKSVAATDPELAAQNNIRLLQEDSIRNAYIATFIDSTASAQLALSKNMDAAKLWQFHLKSRGNWHEISEFVNGLNEDNSLLGMEILAQISEKDLHDITANVLNDHLEAYQNYLPQAALAADIVNSYVLSPRMGREFVTKWRSFIQQYFDEAQALAFRENPMQIKEWIMDHITEDVNSNYYNVAINPEAVLQLERADIYSRNLLFVAIGRSFGIPARLEPATRRPQYFADKSWHDVFFVPQSTKSTPRGKLQFRNLSPDKDFNPRYYVHYTIARYDNGRFITLDYEYDADLLQFPATVTVDTGFYRLITGNRMSGGEVVTNISYFNVEENKTQTVDIILGSGSERSGVIGKAEMSSAFLNLETNDKADLRSVLGKAGLVVAIIDPTKEPTKHLMEDLKAVEEALNQWDGNFLFVVAADKLNPAFTSSAYTALPKNTVFGYDSEGDVGKAISLTCAIDGTPQWPVISLLNTKGEIIWYSEGYSIGLGDQLVKQLKAPDGE